MDTVKVQENLKRAMMVINNIRVPVGLAEQISLPLMDVMGMIREAVEEINKTDDQTEEKPGDQE